MAKCEKEVKELLEYVGGKENIASLMHCVTRLRFVLKDESKVDIKKIEALPTVKGTFTQAGQFQVIIGNQVSEFYKEFAEYAGIQAVSKEEVKQAAKQNQNLAQRAVSNLAEIFAPLIPAIIVGGLLLGFRSVIGDIYMLNDGTATLKDVYPWCQGLYDFLWLIGINLKYVYPFIGGMLGSGIGGLFSMFFVCKASSVGVGGIPGILSMKIESIPMFAIAMVIALVLPVLFTMILSKTKLNKFGKA